MSNFVKLRTSHGEARVRVESIAYVLPITSHRCQIEFIGGAGGNLCIELGVEALMNAIEAAEHAAPRGGLAAATVRG